MRDMLVLRAFAIMVSAALATSCGGTEGKIRSEFVAGCTSQGATKALCKCAFSKLEARYGINAMVEMKEHNIAPPKFAEAVFAAGAQCRAGDTGATLTIPSDSA